jgi:hypothetical protein
MLDAWRVTGLEGFLSHYVARDSMTRAIVGEEKGRVNLDDRNLVEFAFARSVGAALFQSDELRSLAAQRNEDRPSLEGKEPDWVAVDWHGASARTEEGLAVPTTDSNPDVARRLAAHAAFLDGNLRGVHDAWVAGPWEIVGPLELAMIGEALADSGSASAIALADTLRPFQPAEADAILARYLWSQGKYRDCYEAVASALRRYRDDPWPLSPVMRRLLAVAAVPGVQRARERAGRVVPDDDPDVEPAGAQRLCLELGVLQDGAPEGPRERDDDADLHAPKRLVQPGVMLDSCSRTALPSCTPTSADRSPRRSSGRSRTSRGSRCRSRTTGSSSGSSPSPIHAASPT